MTTEVKIVPMTPLSLDLKAAGKAMSLSDRTVWALIKEGRLRSVRVGVKHLVPVREIEAFLEREAGTAEKPENLVDVEAK